MILEFDSMVGAYVEAIEDAGVTANTILIVTSDHGDMNMEHQQFYKMVGSACQLDPLWTSSDRSLSLVSLRFRCRMMRPRGFR